MGRGGGGEREREREERERGRGRREREGEERKREREKERKKRRRGHMKEADRLNHTVLLRRCPAGRSARCRSRTASSRARSFPP